MLDGWGRMNNTTLLNPTALTLLHKAERESIAAHGLHLGLSDEAAAESYAALMAGRNKDYQIGGVMYRAAGRIDARMQHEDCFGVLAPLWAVVEIV